MNANNPFDRAIEAVITGDAAALKQLLADHPDLSTARAPNGRGHATLLHYISANGVDDHHQKTPPNAVEIAEILFNAGANPDATAEFYGGGPGSTPLVCLVSSAHPHQAGVQADLVHTYIRHGAQPNGLNDDGLPAANALEHWYPAAFTALFEAGARIDNLVHAAAVGRIDLMRSMLAADTLKPYTDASGKPVTEPDALKALSFVKACLCDQLEAVRLLMADGVDVNVRLDHNRTGLHEAAWAGADSVVDYLLEQGVDTGIRDEQFDSMPVQWAFVANRQSTFERLLPHSELPIELAAQFGQLDRVQALLAANPKDVNGADGTGAPLRAAAVYNHPAVVQYLLEQGADPSLASSNGQTALDFARRIGHREIIDLLERR
jgi:ankyrin repeat protein